MFHPLKKSREKGDLWDMRRYRTQQTDLQKEVELKEERSLCFEREKHKERDETTGMWSEGKTRQELT